MTRLVSLNDLSAFIDQFGVESFMRQLVDRLDQDFRQWPSFQKSPRLVTHYPQGVMELMPVANDDYYAYKFVNGHPGNTQQGKFCVVAMGMLAEVASGYPLLLCEMTLLTAFRTACTSALAAKYLVSSPANAIGIIGTGTQSEFQVLAHHFILGCKDVYYYDIDPSAMDKFSANLLPFGLNLQPCANAQEVVESADVVITATAAKKKAIVIDNDWVRPGQYINAIGGDCQGKTELDPELLKRSTVVVEYLKQTEVEGEIQHGAETVYAELWEIITNKKVAPHQKDAIVVFDSVGFAIEDFSVLMLLHQLAEKYSIGQDVAMVPASSQDPKDLFSLLAGSTVS